ncbi:MAG: hypothetical protein K2G87_00700 [Oscillospiraceae bacterium]|nr:hypothetical protein [Oscillospiraceae bacterium]
MRKSKTIFTVINIISLIAALAAAKIGIDIMCPVYITCGGGGLTIYKAEFAKGMLLVAAGCLLPVISNVSLHISVYKKTEISREKIFIFSAVSVFIVLSFFGISALVMGYPNYWSWANWI